MGSRRWAVLSAILAALGFSLILMGWLWPAPVANCPPCPPGHSCPESCALPGSSEVGWILAGALVLFSGVGFGVLAWWRERSDDQPADRINSVLRITGAVGVGLFFAGLGLMLFINKASGLGEVVVGFGLAWGSFVAAFARHAPDSTGALPAVPA